jgi:hypothetical protein
VISVLTALDRDHHDLLERLLSRCCAASEAYIEDNGGLCELLSSEEMLETDAAADREDRRARKGFISPSSAASFLSLAKKSDLSALVASKTRDPVTKAYFRELETRPLASVRAKTDEKTPAPSPIPLLETLRDFGVVADAAPPLLPNGAVDPFRGAMAALLERNPEKHASRMAELAYVANVLIVGASIDGRRYLPVEAAKTAVDICAAGFERLAGESAGDEKRVDVLSRTGADKLFLIGWRLRA